jgi:copper chaperone CopZ
MIPFFVSKKGGCNNKKGLLFRLSFPLILGASRDWTSPSLSLILSTMKRLILILVATFPVALGIGCRQQEIRTVTVTLSGVSGEADIQAISNAVSQLDGVFDESVAFHGTGSVAVRYDSMKLARKNIEYAVVEAGFGANDIPAKRREGAVPAAGPP